MSALQQEIETVVEAALARQRAWLEERLARLVAAAPASAPEDRTRALSIAEAAARAHRTPDTLRRAIKAGKLKASRPEGAREWVVMLGDLLDYLRPAPPPVRDEVDRRAGLEDVLARARGGRPR